MGTAWWAKAARRRLLRLSLACAAALSLASCGSHHVDRDSRWGFEPGGKLYVARPMDPQYSEPFHNEVADVVAQYYPARIKGKSPEDIRTALQNAAAANAAYLFYPIVEASAAHRGIWEAARTVAPTRRAMLNLRVHVYDSHSGKLIETTRLRSRGGWGQSSPASKRTLQQLLATYASR